MKSRNVLMLMLIFTGIGYTQNPPANTRNFLQNKYVLERLTGPDQMMMGTVQALPMAPPEVIGSDLLNKYYNQTTFLLQDSALLEGLPSRYYVMRNEFDIKTKMGVRTLKGDRVKSFIWVDSLTNKPQVFVNMKEYVKDDGVPGTGFMQLLCEGKVGLLRHTEVIFKEANYHVALNVGNRDHQFIHKTRLYYLIGNTFRPVPESRKKVIHIFPDRTDQIEKFIRMNQLDPTKEHHLIAIVEYYNALN
jgi:hypothetical protein